MGNPNFTVGPGEGVFVDVPWDAQGREVTVTLTFKPLRGRGRDRQRCEARYNGRRATIERRDRALDPDRLLRVFQYIDFFKLVRCQFDDQCDQCNKPTGGTWASLSHIPEQGVEADFYICGDCMKAQAALGWCKTCGNVPGDGKIVESCSNCEGWEQEAAGDD